MEYQSATSIDCNKVWVGKQTWQRIYRQSTSLARGRKGDMLSGKRTISTLLVLYYLLLITEIASSQEHLMNELHTARLYLQPVERSDLDTLHQLIIHPDVRRFLCDGEILAKEQIEAWIEESLSLFATNRFGLWIVVPNLSREHSPNNHFSRALIGLCGFWYFHTPPELELLFCIAPDYWNQGFATEVAQALIHYGFEQLTLDRIAASTDVSNTASI